MTFKLVSFKPFWHKDYRNAFLFLLHQRDQLSASADTCVHLHRCLLPFDKFFDIFFQTTGTTLSARARAQINIAVLRNEDFSGIDKVDNTIVPLLWFDEGLDELSDDLRDEIAKAVEDPPIYKGYVLIFLGCLVGVVVAVGTISAVMTCR